MASIPFDFDRLPSAANSSRLARPSSGAAGESEPFAVLFQRQSQSVANRTEESPQPPAQSRSSSSNSPANTERTSRPAESTPKRIDSSKPETARASDDDATTDVESADAGVAGDTAADVESQSDTTISDDRVDDSELDAGEEGTDRDAAELIIAPPLPLPVLLAPPVGGEEAQKISAEADGVEEAGDAQGKSNKAKQAKANLKSLGKKSTEAILPVKDVTAEKTSGVDVASQPVGVEGAAEVSASDVATVATDAATQETTSGAADSVTVSAEASAAAVSANHGNGADSSPHGRSSDAKPRSEEIKTDRAAAKKPASNSGKPETESPTAESTAATEQSVPSELPAVRSAGSKTERKTDLVLGMNAAAKSAPEAEQVAATSRTSDTATVDALAKSAAADTNRPPPVDAAASAVNAANTALTAATPASRFSGAMPRGVDRGEAAPNLTPAEHSRFMQRITKAFQAAQDRDGEIRLRLSPPDLGSLRLEMKVTDGVMNARLEAESQQTRTLLMDNLPQLRERLADQGIRIEKFDVEVADRRSNGSPQENLPRDQSQNENSQGPRRLRPGVPESAAAEGPVRPRATRGADGRLNLIV